MSPELRQYLETVLWSETDNADDRGGEPLDRNYGVGDFTTASVERAKRELKEFIEQTETAIAVLHDMAEERGEEDEERYFDSTDLAHDFWLTRSGHGTGFWDRPEKYGELLAEKLSDIAESFGECYVFVRRGRVSFDPYEKRSYEEK